MSRRLATALAIAAAVAIVAVLSFYALAPGASPTLTASPTLVAATATATQSATTSPSSTSQGVYMSKKLGYALELPPSWHQASCGNSDPVDTRLPAIEQVTSASPMDEFIGHVGTTNDRVEVDVVENPGRLSPMEFVAAGTFIVVSGTPRSVTFAGRPAAQVEATSPSGEALAYYVADADRMYVVLYRTDRGPSDPKPDLAAMQRIVGSFRFLSASEGQALPDPTPIPAAAPTAQALAGMLATAFQQKDAATLERLLGPCVSFGVQNGGGSRIARQLFIAGVRAQFANGLVVTVDPNAMRTGPFDGGQVTYVRSRWNAAPPSDLRPPPSPGQATQNVDLMLTPTRGGFYWSGTLLVP